MQLKDIDAALGFSFLDIEVAFEIVVFCLFGDFPKARKRRGTAVLGPMKEFARRNKTNTGAGEIDPGGIGHWIEIWRIVKARTGKIGDMFESAAGEIGPRSKRALANDII